jgi:Fe-S cluster biogenesis protein NfuA
MTVPLHPQRTDHPDELCWHPPHGLLPNGCVVARAADLAPPLAALLTEGVLTQVRIERGTVITRLAPHRTWTGDGPRVRTALHTALAGTGRAHPSGPPTPGQHPDQALQASAERLLAGAVGDLARSHGGRIELLTVHDGHVEVTLHGACHGCPAARTTLTVHLEEQLRALHPDLRSVRQADPTRPRRRRLLPLSPATTGQHPEPT